MKKVYNTPNGYIKLIKGYTTCPLLFHIKSIDYLNKDYKVIKTSEFAILISFGKGLNKEYVII